MLVSPGPLDLEVETAGRVRFWPSIRVCDVLGRAFQQEISALRRHCGEYTSAGKTTIVTCANIYAHSCPKYSLGLKISGIDLSTFACIYVLKCVYINLSLDKSRILSYRAYKNHGPDPIVGYSGHGTLAWR
jgi:hypothetical protein